MSDCGCNAEREKSVRIAYKDTFIQSFMLGAASAWLLGSWVGPWGALGAALLGGAFSAFTGATTAAYYALFKDMEGCECDPCRCNPYWRKFDEASDAREDPLVIDLNRDGKTDLTNTVYFDLDANGFAERTAWIDGSDGMLFLDLNNNGRLDDGSELFGNRMLVEGGYTTGFGALMSVNGYNDKYIDSGDEIYSRLRILTDVNGDGKVDMDEFVTMEEAGITGIDLRYLTDTSGNTVKGGELGATAAVVWGNTRGLIREVLPNRIPMMSIPHEIIEVPEEIQALPDLLNSGILHSLHQAMARDESGDIRRALEAYMAVEHISPEKQALLDELLYTWAGVENVAPTSRGGKMDARQLEFLEKFMGMGFMGKTPGQHSMTASPNPNHAAAGMLEELYRSIADEAESALLIQTTLQGFIEAGEYELNEETNELTMNHDTSFVYLNNLLEEDHYQAMLQIEALQKVYKTMGVLDGEESERSFSETLGTLGAPKVALLLGSNIENYVFEDDAGIGFSSLSGSECNDLVSGGSGDDILSGEAGDDILDANAGNDTLDGGGGNDILIGGLGDDRLIGGTGDDTYIWHLGDGNDTINDYKLKTSGPTGTLEIGEGVDPSGVVLTRVGDNAVFIIGESGERITVENWYKSVYYQLAQIKFADGTVWTHAGINSTNPILHAPEEGGTVTGTASNDTLYGSDYADTLDGGDGNDILIGGLGDDRLIGGTGDDTYIWRLGDGNDTINDYKLKTSGPTGTLEIGEGVDPSSVVLTRVGDNAVLIIGESGERVTVENWYKIVYYQLARIKFADGTVWTNADINAMSPILRAPEEGGMVTGTASNDTLYGGDYADTLDGGGGNDILIGGLGDDRLIGGTGDDTYIWHLGDGNDTINDYKLKTSGPTGTLEIGEGVDPSGVELTRVGDNAVFIIGESGERVTVENWYKIVYYQLAQIKFADGTVWMNADINAMSPIHRAPAEGGMVTGTASNDTLYGSDYADTLNGGDGNDILIGGTGDDRLIGGTGDDTYIWRLGDGNDTINDRKLKIYGQSGTLEISGGVDPSGVELTRVGDNAVFLINESGERIVVEGWFINSYYQLAQIKFADGTVWTNADVNDIASGVKEPFSVSSQTQGAQSASIGDTSDTADSLSPLSASAWDPLSGAAEVWQGDGWQTAAARASGPTDWSCDPALAEMMYGPKLCGASDFELARLNVDLAVAQLRFAPGAPEQVCDLVGAASSSLIGQPEVAFAHRNEYVADYGLGERKRL